MKTYPFYNAITHLKEFFDITMTNDEFETIGLHAWDKIGNKSTATFYFRGKVQDTKLDLPCNADIIELITAGQEDYQRTDNISVDNYTRGEIETFIEEYKSSSKPWYHRGSVISYERVGDTLIFDKTVKNVNIIYRGVILDEEGLPYLNFKEVEAIATYCAYVHMNKKGMMTRDQATVQIAQMIKQDWMRLCDNARTPIDLNQNDINDILDVKSSWDRKRHGVSYKLYH